MNKYFINDIIIQSITLTSPHNSAMLENIEISLNKPASISVKYWKKDDKQKYKTPITRGDTKHIIHLVLLEPNTTYEYQVIIKHALWRITSQTASFHTRKQSPWLIHNWINKKNNYASKALAKGMIMVCYGGIPGYIAIIDGNGEIRWYWQTDSIGVRTATLTPRGTILALLHNPSLDKLNDLSNENEREELNNMKAPIRRGRIGFAGGTAITEISTTGKVLWKTKINYNRLGYFCIHHDLRMDKEGNILALTRDPLVINDTIRNILGVPVDTLWGDALVKIDTTGKILWKWSTWDDWNIRQDSKIKKLWYDRFHLNAIYICKDGNYLISSALENQIWKINSKTGMIMWKLGKYGNLKMDSSNYFHFQHDVNIDKNGDLIIFDNGDFMPFIKSPNGKNSRVLTFNIDSINMIATAQLKLNLPHRLYSSRMGSAYMLPNNNLLITSSKKKTIVVMSPEGKILLELKLNFIPYRAEYIPDSVWNKYFTPI